MGKAKTFVGALSIACVLGVAGCASLDEPGGESSSNGADNPSTTSIRLALTRDLSSLANLVAVDQGFFADRGLEVDASFITDSTTLPQLTGQTFDIACMVQTQFLAAVSQGFPLTIVSGGSVDTATNPQAGLMVLPDSGIENFQDLAGKTIGTPSVTGTLILALKSQIEAEGGDPNSIKPQAAPIPQLGDLLEAKRVDAIISLSPFMTGQEKRGFVNLGDPFRALGDRVMQNACASTQTWAEDNAAAVTALREAQSEASEYIEANEDYAKELFAEKAEIDPSVLEGSDLPTYDSTIYVDNVRAWQDLMVQFGALTTPLDVEKYVS